MGKKDKQKSPQVGVALIVRRGNNVLLHKRISNHQGGKWAFAGGHLEKFETIEECALRELKEEAGNIKVTKPQLLQIMNVRFRDDDKHYLTLFYIADYIDGTPKVMEPKKCAEWKWFDWDNLPQNIMPGIEALNIKITRIDNITKVGDIWEVTSE